MTAFGPIEGDTCDSVKIQLDQLYKPGGYTVTRWEEKYISIGIFKKKKVHAAYGYLVEQETDLDKNKREILNSLNRGANENNIGSQLQQLTNAVEQLRSTQVKLSEPQWDKNVLEIKRILEMNDFTPEYINQICTRIHENLPQAEVRQLETLKEKVVDWIAEGIQIAPSIFEDDSSGMKVVALVGYTGVGKTTTMVKLVANYTIDKNNVFFSTDQFKIGAEAQVRRYAEILGSIPFENISEPKVLESKFWESSALGRDYVFIDTPGISPTQFKLMATIEGLLESCKDDVYTMLIMPVSIRYNDMINNAEKFDRFNYKGIIFSKFDESSTVGTVLSFMKEKKKPALFFTAGQDVLKDIEIASKEFLLNKLIGFGKSAQFR